MSTMLKLPPEANVLFKGSSVEPPDADSETFEIKAPTGRTLHIRRWLPKPDVPVKPDQPVIVMVHGLGGSSSWMSRFAAKLMERQPLVYGLDLPDVGHNPTQKGHFDSYNDLVGDIRNTIEWASKENGGRKVFLVSLSLGGALSTVLGDNPPKELVGNVFIVPAYKTSGDTFRPMLYVNMIYRLLLEKVTSRWGFPRKHIELPYAEDEDAISRNPEKVRLIHDDPERVKGLTAHSWMELFKLTNFHLKKKIQQMKLPSLVFVAGKDTVCDSQAMVEAFNTFPLKAKDKKLVIFPEAFHDLVFEPEMPRMAEYTLDWIAERLFLNPSEASLSKV